MGCWSPLRVGLTLLTALPCLLACISSVCPSVGACLPARIDCVHHQGEQECKLCRRLIRNAEDVGRSMYSLCGGEYPEYYDMCHAQQKVLQGCPEFSNSESRLLFNLLETLLSSRQNVTAVMCMC